jgi:hypothetical protein
MRPGPLIAGEARNFRKGVLHLGTLRPYSQIFGYARKDFQGKML